MTVQTVKNLPAMQETLVQSLDWEDPLEKGVTTVPVFLPREFHGQRSLVGYSPWGHKESDTTEQLSAAQRNKPPWRASLVPSGQESTSQCRRHGFHPWVGQIPWRREWLPTPVFLPGEFHGQRSLVGYSPWGRKESETI